MTDASSRRRPVVLAFVRYYLPGFKSGGPVRTIANMVEALGDTLDFRIVTSDRDASDASPYPHLADARQWVEVGKAKVLYLDRSRMTVAKVAHVMRSTPHDTLYLNSFLDPVFTARPLVARRLGLAPRSRCVIAPRGEFSAGALKLKAGKKRAYIAAMRAVGLYNDLHWQASSPWEAEDIKRVAGRLATDIRVAPNLFAGAAAEGHHTPRPAGEPLRLVFLSRISPMKNLDFVLQVLGQVSVPVQLDIYGQSDDEVYWARCKAMIDALPLHVVVRSCGLVDHSDVIDTLARYDALFLPTRGENYGHAIVESLAAGTPVLISDATPWRDLQTLGIGWDLPLSDPSSFVRCIEQLAGMQSDTYLDYRRRAAAFAAKLSQDDNAISANLNLLTGSVFDGDITGSGQGQ